MREGECECECECECDPTRDGVGAACADCVAGPAMPSSTPIVPASVVVSLVLGGDRLSLLVPKPTTTPATTPCTIFATVSSRCCRLTRVSISTEQRPTHPPKRKTTTSTHNATGRDTPVPAVVSAAQNPASIMASGSDARQAP